MRKPSSDLSAEVASFDRFYLLEETADARLALEHLEAGVDEMDSIVDRLELGALVHDVGRGDHLAAIV